MMFDKEQYFQDAIRNFEKRIDDADTYNGGVEDKAVLLSVWGHLFFIQRASYISSGGADEKLIDCANDAIKRAVSIVTALLEEGAAK